MTAKDMVIEDLAMDCFQAQQRLLEAQTDLKTTQETLKVALEQLYTLTVTVAKLRERQRELSELAK